MPLKNLRVNHLRLPIFAISCISIQVLRLIATGSDAINLLGFDLSNN